MYMVTEKAMARVYTVTLEENLDKTIIAFQLPHPFPPKRPSWTSRVGKLL